MFAQNHDRSSGITPFGCLLGKRPSARSIMQSCRTAALIFCCLFSGASVNAADLRSAIEAAPERGWGLIVERSWPSVARFYAERDFTPVWSLDGRPTAAAEAAVAAIRQSGREGLAPSHYRADALEADMAAMPLAATFDRQLTGEFLHFVSELQFGRLATPDGYAGSDAQSPDHFDAAAILATISTAADPAQAIRQLAPFASQYRSLRRALALYRDNAARGGWEPVAAGQTIKPGMSDSRLPSIRKRLAASGDLPPALAESRDERYDEATRLAMESLQRRYGLDADGVVGKMSLAAMNVPAAERVEQISLNMERWRRYTEDLDSTQIVVNLAGFDLTVFEKGQDVLRMPVAVGRPFRRTPIFNGLMTYLEFSPTWTVPPTILKEDILPKLRSDPTYLATKGIEVYESWQPNASKLTPETIDWRGLGRAAQSYRFVQPPGPKNALGGVKFMFPNEHSIYLHDTPDRGIFAKASRAFSSGCIRVQRPAELAAYLLKGQGNWDIATVREAMNQTAPQRVNLASPVTVRITYSTVWVGDGGDVNFREDVYGRDATLREMLLSSSEAH